MNQFKHVKWWRSYLDKLWQSFWKLKFMKNQALELHSPLPKSFKVCKERTTERGKTEWRKQRTAAAVFFRTFGALPEVHFLHAIYHFKAQEVKNPTLQTVYDFELKWGRYGLWNTTASSWGTISHHEENLLAKWCSHDLMQFSSEGHIFLISAPNRTRFEVLDSWLLELWNGI